MVKVAMRKLRTLTIESKRLHLEITDLYDAFLLHGMQLYEKLHDEVTMNLTNETFVVKIGTKTLTEFYYKSKIGWIKISSRGRKFPATAEQVFESHPTSDSRDQAKRDHRSEAL